jgi:hypothetical protein
VINFRGTPYEARNGEWVRIKPTTMIDRHILMAHFEQSVDMSGELLSAAMEKVSLQIWDQRDELHEDDVQESR